MADPSGAGGRFSRRRFLLTAALACGLLAARIAALPAWRPLLDEEAGPSTPDVPPALVRRPAHSLALPGEPSALPTPEDASRLGPTSPVGLPSSPAPGAALAQPTATPAGLTADELADQRTSFLALRPFSPPRRPLTRLRVNRVEGDTTVDVRTWTLRIDGLVGKSLVLTYDDLRRFPATVQVGDFYCVEGWGVRDVKWEGIRLSKLLEAVEPASSGRWVNFFTFPNVYRDSLSLEQALLPDVLLAYRLWDEPLPEQHGFPLRLVVPGMYGYKSVKWLTRLELIDRRQLGYWERRGWPPDPWIQ